MTFRSDDDHHVIGECRGGRQHAATMNAFRRFLRFCLRERKGGERPYFSRLVISSIVTHKKVSFQRSIWWNWCASFCRFHMLKNCTKVRRLLLDRKKRDAKMIPCYVIKGRRGEWGWGWVSIIVCRCMNGSGDVSV